MATTFRFRWIDFPPAITTHPSPLMISAFDSSSGSYLRLSDSYTPIPDHMYCIPSATHPPLQPFATSGPSSPAPVAFIERGQATLGPETDRSLRYRIGWTMSFRFKAFPTTTATTVAKDCARVNVGLPSHGNALCEFLILESHCETPESRRTLLPTAHPIVSDAQLFRRCLKQLEALQASP